MVWITVAVVVIALVFSAFKILNEYERGVILTLGRYTSTKGPGLIIVIPGLQKIVRVDLRTVVMDVPTQDVISRDNVSVKVNAVLYFRVVDAAKATLQVERYWDATSQVAQTTLRSVLGQHELDDMLTERDKLNRDIQTILDKQTDAWGIKISNVEIKHVDLDESMIRAIARQAEAERSRRAKIINAEGEQQAAEKLKQAALKREADEIGRNEAPMREKERTLSADLDRSRAAERSEVAAADGGVTSETLPRRVHDASTTRPRLPPPTSESPAASVTRRG